MTCLRCGGAMNHEEFCNDAEGSVPWGYTGWRCLYCGDVIDPLILQNRRRPMRRAKPPRSSYQRRPVKTMAG